MGAPWIDLVNSDRTDHTGRGDREDRIESEAWVRDYLQRHGLEPIGPRPRAALEQFRDLRVLLRRLAASMVGGGRIGAGDLKALNGYLAGGPTIGRVERDGDAFRLRREPVRAGIGGTLSRIAWSFAESLVRADRGRLRICDNPDCQWVFYDESRSRTRRWCADECGNLLKVRRFRAKKRRAHRHGGV